MKHLRHFCSVNYLLSQGRWPQKVLIAPVLPGEESQVLQLVEVIKREMNDQVHTHTRARVTENMTNVMMKMKSCRAFIKSVKKKGPKKEL